MISAEGAGVIATIIPIALLIVGFEIQRTPSFVATGRTGSVLLWSLGLLLLLALLFGMAAEVLLIAAVARWEPIPADAAISIWIGLVLLGIASWYLLLASLLDRLGILKMLAARATNRLGESPRRLARAQEYISKHHPDAG